MKKRKSRVETERKILEAALSVFSEQGYEATSIQTIAGKADVNGALINRYFGSKSDLLKAILVSGCEMHFNHYSCNPLAETLEEEIARFFLSEIKTDFEHRDLIRLVFMRSMLDPEIESLLNGLHTQYGRQDLVKCLMPFQERGDIPQDMDLVELSYILLLHSGGFGATIHILNSNDRETIERRALASAKIFADGLKTAARASKTPQKP